MEGGKLPPIIPIEAEGENCGKALLKTTKTSAPNCGYFADPLSKELSLALKHIGPKGLGSGPGRVGLGRGGVGLGPGGVGPGPGGVGLGPGCGPGPGDCHSGDCHPSDHSV